MAKCVSLLSGIRRKNVEKCQSAPITPKCDLKSHCSIESMLPSWLSDAGAIEQKLVPYEDSIKQLQSILFWRDPLPFAGIATVVNAVFCVIFYFDLSFIPTFLFIFAVKALLDAAFRATDSFCVDIMALFPSRAGNYPTFAIADVAQVLARCGRFCQFVADQLFPRDSASVKSVAVTIGILFGLLLFFAWIGTFWIAFILANGFLFLPGTVFHSGLFEWIQNVMQGTRH
jgi:hypothetical protein